MQQGRLIAIEGPDGCGKATQAEKLINRLAAEGLRGVKISFPRYETPSGQLVKQYLNGALGPADKVDPWIASMLYARDRAAAVSDILRCQITGFNVIFDRYAASNLAHQGGKINALPERWALIDNLARLEFDLLKIPKPDLTVILSVPFTISYQLLLDRAAKTGRPLDDHEKNKRHLMAAAEVYEILPQKYPGYALINCVENGSLLSPEVIHEKVWRLVSPLL